MSYTDDLIGYFCTSHNKKSQKEAYSYDNNKCIGFFVREFTKTKNIKPDKMKEMFKEIRDGSESSLNFRNMIVKSCLRLVISIAKRYTKKNHRTNLMDNIQNGIVGLIRATEKYDPVKHPNVMFHTYASYWIKSEILKNVVKENREPHPSGFAVEYTIDNRENLEYKLQKKAMIRDLLTTITPRQKHVILLRFGLSDKFDCHYDKMGLKEIGETFDPPISKERVRQIESEALDKLRNNIKGNYHDIIEEML